MEKHFCTCTDSKCPFNPKNDNCVHKHCDLCIAKCLKEHEIPSCFFKDIHPDTSSNKDWTYAGFVAYFQKHSA